MNFKKNLATLIVKMSNIFDTFGLLMEHQWLRTAFLTSEMLVRAVSSSLEDKHVWMFLDFLLPAALNKSFFSFFRSV